MGEAQGLSTHKQIVSDHVLCPVCSENHLGCESCPIHLKDAGALSTPQLGRGVGRGWPMTRLGDMVRTQLP